MTETSFNRDLLTPSLGGVPIRQAPYSARTGFLTSFFGGPVSAVAIAALNAYRLGRVRVDFWWLVPALAGYTGFEIWQSLTLEGKQFHEWMMREVGSSATRVELKVIAMAIYAISSFAHAREQRAASIMGIARPDGRWMGAGLVLAGGIVSFALETYLQ